MLVENTEVESEIDLAADGKDLVPASRIKAALKSAGEKHKAELEAANAKIEAANAKAREIEARLATVEQGGKRVDAPLRYTRQQLNAAITAGTISQDQADQIWDDQSRAETAAVANNVVTQAQHRQAIEAELARYTKLVPDITKDGSDIRADVNRHFQKLVNLGDPGTVGHPQLLVTQLKAVRMALGDIDQLEAARSGRTDYATHRETGGGGGGGNRGGGKSLYDKLDVNSKAHYEKMIAAGQYADEAAVEAELKWAQGRGREIEPPRTRRRAA